jgi:hypothetical protein
VTYKTGFGLRDWIHCTLYIHTVQDYRQDSAIAILHAFQFTAAHALGFSVFTIRILATNLSQSHCHFNSYMKSSWHSLIPFVPFLLTHLRLPSPELNQVLLTTVLHSFYYCSSEFLCPFITPRHEPQGKHPCIVKVACLLVRYLVMDVLLSRGRVLRECVYRVAAKQWVYKSHYHKKYTFFWNGTPQSRPEHTAIQPRRKLQP